MSVKIRMTYTEVEEMAGVIRLSPLRGELETIAEQSAEQREMSANAEVGGSVADKCDTLKRKR